MANGYDPQKAIAYARQWAVSRNPDYLDFHLLGGDCTNFVSQCLYAGCQVMNYTPVYGWYYRSASDRTASWSGVEYLERFLTANKGNGPYAEQVVQTNAEIGDVVQFALKGASFTHAALIVAIEADEIYVAAHTIDAWRRPLSSYGQPLRRFLHILGARNE